MGIWQATQIPLPPQLPPGGQIDLGYVKTLNDYVKKLANTVAAIRNDLEFMLNGHLDANNIRANSIETKNLKAGAVTADKIHVDELSAISANVGKVTSGEIYGNYIATRENAYPRAEMSNTEDLFGAYKDANNGVTIEADYGGAPSQVFITQGILKARISTLLGTLLIDAIDRAEINVTNNGNLVLPPFSRVIGNGKNLGAELDDKALAGISTNPSGGHNHGIPDGTVLQKADGGTVTFYAAPTHTHQQTN